MTTRNTIIGGTCVFLVLTLTVTGAVFGKQALDRRKHPASQAAVAGTSSPGPAPIQPNDLKVGGSPDLGGGLYQPAPKQSPGGTGSAVPTSPAPAASSSTSKDFKDYEQYKGQEAALFGEIRLGSGNEVSMGSTVAIYYKGWLTDGTLFDQSLAEKAGEQPKPLIFKVGEHKVVLGMEQGLLGMKGGGKRRIVIPPKVGYGERGYGPVPSNALLIFDVELVDVQ